MGTRSRQAPQRANLNPLPPGFMEDVRQRVRDEAERFIEGLKAEWQEMVCPKCGRGIMNPTYVGPVPNTCAYVTHPAFEHIDERCTMCSYGR